MNVGKFPHDWYWRVGGSETEIFSSRDGGVVPIDSTDFIAWSAEGNRPTDIATQDELVDVLRKLDVPPYHLVAKRVIVDRLQTVGLLDAARAALDAADLYTRERWNNREMIYADDPTSRDLLVAIGADPDAILAPES